jgi:hypothetical protein
MERGSLPVWFLEDEGGPFAWCPVGDAERAREIRAELSSLAGSRIEDADGGFLYCRPFSLEDAEADLREAGYPCKRLDKTGGAS